MSFSRLNTYPDYPKRIKPDDENYHDYLDSGVGIYANDGATVYEIELTESGLKWVEEEPWHQNQQVSRKEDGSIVLEVAGNHDMEIIPRVLAFGEHAKIIRPQQCQDAIKAIIDNLARSYRNE